LAIMWRRRTFSSLVAVGSVMVAVAAYPPVVNKIPFHPSATNMFQATMELAIVSNTLVLASLALFAASSLGWPLLPYLRWPTPPTTEKRSPHQVLIG